MARTVNAVLSGHRSSWWHRRRSARLAAPIIEGVEGDDGGGRMDRRVLGASSSPGVLDVIGLVSFAYGLEHAETWLVGLASSFGPAVTIIVAVALLGERLRADPVGRPGRDPRRDDRDRPALARSVSLFAGGAWWAVLGNARIRIAQKPVQLLTVPGARAPTRTSPRARPACRRCGPRSRGRPPSARRAFPAVVRIGQAADEPGRLHPVEPVGHRAAREPHVLGQLSGRVAVGRPDLPQLPEHMEGAAVEA